MNRLALGEDFTRRFPSRVFVERYGRGALAPGGPSLEGPRLRRAPAEYVAVDPGTRTRIVAEAPGIRFLVYVDRDDLRRVPMREVALLAAPDRAFSRESQAGVTLFPGAALGVLSRDGEWAEVKLEDSALEARGWVRADAIGSAYVPVPPRVLSQNAAVRAPAVVLDRPHGAVIARVTRSLSVVRGAPEDGFIAVELERPALGRESELSSRARGWVAEADVTADAITENEEPGKAVERSGAPHRAKLPAGTRLCAALGGEMVGVTLPEAEAYERAHREGWTELTFETAWGELTAWADER